MKTLLKMKNKIMYNYYKKLSDKAYRNMNKHVRDAKSDKFKKWGDLNLFYIRKLVSIEYQ